MKRSPLRRTGPPKRRTRLRPIGKRGRERQRRMTAVRAQLEQAGVYRCEAAGFSLRCTGEGVHLHHVLPRSRGGDESSSNLILVCHACHDWIHTHPTQAQQRGLLR